MVDAKELRIGNWVSFVEDANKYKDYHEVTDISASKVLCHNGDVELELYPIPLTKEILEKCGFYWSIYHQAFYYGDGAMNEFYDLNDCYPTGYQLSTFKRKELIGNPFNYLHQLQNLYYALTQTELKIEL